MSSSLPRPENSEFRFRIPVTWNLNSYQLGLIHVIGLDGTPSPCKVRIDRESPAAIDGAIVHVARNSLESGHVYFLFHHPRQGDLLLSTGTLPVSAQHYDLLKELARGTLNRLRNQLSIWQEGGLEIPPSVSSMLQQAVHNLAQAIMIDDLVQQDQSSEQAIVQAVDAIFVLSEHFGQQISRYRCENQELPHFWIAVTVAPQVNEPANADLECDLLRLIPTVNPVNSSRQAPRQLELLGLAGEKERSLILGPWLDASQGGLPESLLQLGDHGQRRTALLTSFRAALETLPNQVRLLHLVSGINGIGHRHLSYPQQFQLTTELLQMAEEALIEVPTMVSFDFPWAERLASAVGGIHPLQIADSLLRQGTAINCFGLEINLDYWPGGSAIRDPFQWIDLIDIWAQLEVPLVLLLRAPFGGAPVPADQPVDRLVNQTRSRTTDPQRYDFLRVVLPMMVARPTVHGLIWQQWQDTSDSRFPHGGMVDAAGSFKAPGALLTQLREWIAECEPTAKD